MAAESGLGAWLCGDEGPLACPLTVERSTRKIRLQTLATKHESCGISSRRHANKPKKKAQHELLVNLALY
jgi:hypothetical protein